MCGIFSCLVTGCLEGQHSEVKVKLLGNLTRRGPDFTSDTIIPIVGGRELYLLGTVLQMRGRITPQPISDDVKCSLAQRSGNSLLWNGNVFGGGVKVDVGENDTTQVFQLLNREPDPGSVLLSLSKIQGPWAFVYWQASTQSLWFGRDVFGRRSLVWHLPATVEDILCLSSVGSCDYKDTSLLEYWSEVPASCIYQLLCSSSSQSQSQLICYPWMQSDVCFQNEQSLTEEFKLLKTYIEIAVVKDAQLQVSFPPLNKSLPQEPKAALSIQETTKSSVVQTPVSPEFGSFEGDGLRPICSKHAEEASIIDSVDWRRIAEDFLMVLEEAVSVRVHNAPDTASCGSHFARQDISVMRSEVDCCGVLQVDGMELVRGKAKIGVLYSGGVDSAVLAALVDRCLPPLEEIDLINVAFSSKPREPLSFAVPDRISAMQSLKDLNPKRKWNLILVDVTAEELNSMRAEHVSGLISPLCTVLDDSIGCALWFGARGRGRLHGQVQQTLYLSQARTLLIGIGADEQLGGYSRHRTKFKRGGWESLLEELDKDIKRLSQRNLGRDDRCVADHHRDGQFPFLDENVVAFLQRLPVWNKVNLTLPRGVGEKRLLREAAALLGCRSATKLPKRAIQFGSRIAKLSGSSSGHESGSDKCDRLIAGP